MPRPILQDIINGVPQSFDTLISLLNNTKMGRQHYGPNDSTIASAIMHPGEGINKGAEWIQNQILQASLAPTRPDVNPVQAQQSTQAGINLAGLAQTGAFPFAPSGAGVVGSIRRPKDIVIPYIKKDFTTGGVAPLNPVEQMWAKYIKNKWATDQDPFVKYVDEGGKIPRSDTMTAIPAPYNDYAQIAGQIGYPGTPPKHYAALDQNDIIGRLRGEGKLPPKAKEHVSQLQELADFARNKFGTNQVAKTPAGRYFENKNDLDAVRNITHPQISMHPVKDTDPNAVYNRNIQSAINNPYYQQNKEDINVFNGTGQPQISMQHINDINPSPGRMSLIDAISNTIRYDETAAKAAEKARFEGQNLIDLGKKELIKELPNGTSWNKLIEPAALQVEGLTQGHCVATYEGKVARGESQIFSLRSADNRPILTAEWNPIKKKMVQVKGRFNAAPTKDLRPYIKDLEDLLNKQ